jgi:hypothetical protein
MLQGEPPGRRVSRDNTLGITFLYEVGLNVTPVENEYAVRGVFAHKYKERSCQASTSRNTSRFQPRC